LVEAEKTQPLLEVEVFILDFLDEARKEHLHLFLQAEHFRDLSVGVLANYVFQLTPLHFLTLFMEQGTLALGCQSVLADEGWLAAVGINADHLAWVSVDALGAAPEGFVHNYKNIISFQENFTSVAESA
jgi:hypothetical protein